MTDKNNPLRADFLWFRLVNSIITEDGNFIAKNTPCLALRWSSDTGKIEVQCYAHVHQDVDKECVGPTVGRGLVISVKPDDLKYLELEANVSCWERKMNEEFGL